MQQGEFVKASVQLAGAAVAALIAACAASTAGAQTAPLPHDYLKLTQTNAGLDVKSNLPTFFGSNPNTFLPNPGSGPSPIYTIGSTYGGYEEFGTNDGQTGGEAYQAIAWRLPGKNLADVLIFNPSGNRGNIEFEAASHQNPGDMNGIPNPPGSGQYLDFNLGCFTIGVPGRYPCPVYTIGQTVTLPMSLYSPTFAYLDVTYIDRTAGVPEPAAWALMILGVAMTGVAARRRRTPVAA